MRLHHRFPGLLRRAGIFVLVFGLAASESPAKRAAETGLSVEGMPGARLAGPEVRDGWLVWRSESSGLVRRLRPMGEERGLGRSGSSREAARAALAAAQDVLGIGPVFPDLEVVLTKRGLASEHVVFQRMAGGVPVEPGRIGVHFGRSGELLSIDCTIDARSAPAKSGAALARAEAMRAATAGTPDAVDPEAALVYVEGEDGLRLVWRVTFLGGEPRGVWEADVDASTGAETGRVNRSMRVDGSGRVWSPNPVNVLQRLDLPDLNDTDQPIFDPAYRIETLRDLNEPVGGAYSLDGRFVSIVDFENPFRPVPVRTHPDSFRVTRADDAFEAVMAYYHLDEVQRYLRGLGFDGSTADSIVVTPIPVDVHAFNGEDNSRYDPPPTHRLAFGDGCVDDAEDADVLVHEYGHAIEYGQVPNWGYGPGYMGPMAEGFSDYWSESRAARLGMTFGLGQVFDWDKGPLDPCWPARRVDNHAVVPDSLRPLTFGNIYTNALIWSGSLWDIHQAIGGDAADRLILESHFFLNGTAPNSTFEDGAWAILQADQQMFAGAHAALISAAFANRGILGEMDAEPPVITHVPLRDFHENELPVPITAVVRDDTSVDPESVSVSYAFTGPDGKTASGSFLLAPAEGDTAFAGTFPEGPGTIGSFTYQIYAVDGSPLRNRAASPASGSHAFAVLPSAPRIRAEGPNPFGERASFRLTLPEDAEVRFTIYDIAGRLVRRPADGPRDRGSSLLEWDGTNEDGRRVAPGIYFYVVETSGFQRTGRLVLLR